MIYKCKICGGNLEVQDNNRTTICEYCGNEQVLPKIHNEQKARLYERAEHYRINNEYDKAIALYENILNEDLTDGEIYWQIVLCTYGVEYVKDKKTNIYIPTCNRTKETSVFVDDNYKNAVKYADKKQKSIYEEEAKKIDIIQKKAIKIANNEEPFDIFICYKETDENGKRTQDSVIAQDLYNNLTKEGYKVFFAKITLEDKLGTEYEPYIFSALNSSKIMIVIGTQKGYFNSVWVKNEWARFLALMKQDNEKVIIPAYKDMNPYDLPEEFAYLQALDLGKIGIIKDLEEKINTTLCKNKSVSKNKSKKNSKIKKRIIILISIIISIVILVAIGIYVNNNYIIPENQYKNAQELLNSKKFNEAIDSFEQIQDYKDSKEKIDECKNKIIEQEKDKLSKYIGVYDKTKTENNYGDYDITMGDILEITNAGSYGIEFELTTGGTIRVASIKGVAKSDGDTYKFTFEDDGWGNKGKGTIVLKDDGVIINTEITKENEMANWSIATGELKFNFSDKVEKEK